MMMRSGFAAVLVATGIGLFAPAARADWQYTKWGMTEAEVVSASAGRAQTVDPQDVRGGLIGTVNRLSAPYAAGKYQFRAIFAFDQTSGRLAVVRLKVLNPADGYGVRAELMGRYGQPVRVTRGTYATTEWLTDSEIVTFIDVAGGAFSVEYRPRSTAEANGL